MYALNGYQASFLKRILLKPLAVPGFAEALSTLTSTRASIFMLHRFSAPGGDVSGHDPAALRLILSQLRRLRYNLISLQEVFRRVREGEPLKRAIAFTIDDGYFDHARIAAPVFAEFDCPVTSFLTTGFLDGKTWFWWDRLTYIFEGTKRAELQACLGKERIVYRLESNAARSSACDDLNVRCQDASEADRLACVLDLSREADVELTANPPARFAPMSWDEAREAEKRGMTFGPHTVTHPVLSTTSDEQAEFEITESWRRLNAEVSRPVPVFCYPNGRSRDFGEREIATMRSLGLWGAVTGEAGEIRPAQFRRSAATPFRVPRFYFLDSLPYVLQCVSGLEMIKARIRRAAA
jgi:peptidoglycan/xylan/chitin deacetylase (PgdA/CDA1 family)